MCMAIKKITDYPSQTTKRKKTTVLNRNNHNIVDIDMVIFGDKGEARVNMVKCVRYKKSHSY